MPSRGLRGLWVRGIAAAAACLLALASTGALVTAAVVTQTGPGAGVLTSHDNGDGGKDNKGHDGGGGDGPGGIVTSTPDKPAKATAPKPTPKPKPAPWSVAPPKPASHPVTSTHPVQPQAPAQTPKVVVDSSDPAPFSAQAVAATEATRVLPIESLGPLSGISFGSGLFIWPVLVAVDVLALAVIARLALRRRLEPSED